ncbi:MAG: AAA family ATPase, partial [Candidatus Limnocylindrales bacterium]
MTAPAAPDGPIVTNADELLGRDAQTRALTRALEDPARPARSIALEGEAGIGKTALVRAAIGEATASGYQVLEARPAEAEMDMALAGLGDLLGPALPAILPALPAPQRIALEVALLLRGGDDGTPDERTLGLATLHGIQRLASVAPVLIAIDDAQWLDPSTSIVLRFALRRLRSEPVVAVIARRAPGTPATMRRGLGPGDLPAVERIVVGPLSLGAIHVLVNERLRISLPRPVLRKVHELSRGNPFYALELARRFGEGTLRFDRWEAGIPDLGALVGERIERLPSITQEVLATAAAASRPTVGLLEAAFADRDIRAGLAPAVVSGVVIITADDITFDHPLLASAALARVGAARRRACHARLAGVVEEPVESARHLALAAPTQDASVAQRVEEAAILTRARGAASGAAELMALAVHITPEDDPAIARRRLTEAEFRLEAGDAPGASALLERLMADTPAGPDRAIVLARLAHFHNLAADTAGGVGLLRQALVEAAPDDPIRAEVHESLAWALVLARHDLPEALWHAERAVTILSDGNDQPSTALSLGLLALVRTLMGLPDEGHMERSLALDSDHPELPIRSRPTHANGYRLTVVDDLDTADRTYGQLLARAEAQGDESAPSHLLGRRSVVRMLMGDLEGAEVLAQQAVELSSQTGQLPTQAAALGRLALIVSRAGDLDRAASLADRSLELAASLGGSSGAGPGAPWTRRPHARGGESALWALGHVALCQERFDEAAAILAALTDPIIDSGVRDPGDLRWLSDEIEALVLAGHVSDARARADLLLGMATAVDRPSAMAAARAALGSLEAGAGRLDTALGHLEAAAVHAEESPLPFERARVQLSLGRVLRRLARKRDARVALEQAIEGFDRIGARHWVRVGQDDLGRIGGRASAGSEVTSSEQRVIELVVRGLSNKEVAAALFVTPKAVEASLSRIYLKRGVRSRAELAATMAAM